MSFDSPDNSYNDENQMTKSPQITDLLENAIIIDIPDIAKDPSPEGQKSEANRVEQNQSIEFGSQKAEQVEEHK